MKGHIRARGHGSWEIKVDLGADPLSGQRRCKWVTVRGGRRDAERECAQLIAEIDAGGHVEPAKLTLAAYLRDWLAGHRHTIAAKTAERYSEHIENHIVPVLGRVLLRKLTTMQLNRFYADRLERGRCDGKGGLSPRTVRHLDRLLHKALGDAVAARQLAVNPADAAKRPKVERRPPWALELDELRAVLERAKDGPLYVPLLVILATGMRRGELLGLNWRQVNLDGASVRIVATLEESRAGLRMKDCKTETSRRNIALPQTAVAALRQHRLEQQQRYLKLGLPWSADALVFGTPLGEPWRPRNFSKAVSRLAKAAGVAFTPHRGRHDHFMRLLAAGTHPKVAQMRAGHASISVTMDIYSHAADLLQRPPAAQIDAELCRLLDPGAAVTVANPVAKRP